MNSERKEIILPSPRLEGDMSVEEAIRKRRSVRSFSSSPLSWEVIGQILWAGQGITEKLRGFRSAPSAGALFPCHLYALLPSGVFKYIPEQHKLITWLKDDIRSALANASLRQVFIEQAPLVIVVTAEMTKTMGRYGLRAPRYVYMEIGHIGQNIQLQAVSLGLDSVCVGAFEDGEVDRLLALPPQEDPFYIIPVGKRR